jgi:hypothetical protein
MSGTLAAATTPARRVREIPATVTLLVQFSRNPAGQVDTALVDAA